MSLNLRLSHAKNELVARECQIKELTKETIELKRENSELHGRQVFRGGRKDGVGALEKCREVGVLKRENSELHGRQVFRGGRKDGVGALEKCREVGVLIKWEVEETKGKWRHKTERT